MENVPPVLPKQLCRSELDIPTNLQKMTKLCQGVFSLDCFGRKQETMCFSENQAIQQILHRRSHKDMTPPDKS